MDGEDKTNPRAEQFHEAGSANTTPRAARLRRRALQRQGKPKERETQGKGNPRKGKPKKRETQEKRNPGKGLRPEGLSYRAKGS